MCVCVWRGRQFNPWTLVKMGGVRHGAKLKPGFMADPLVMDYQSG